jgi:hypothetical protein
MNEWHRSEPQSPSWRESAPPFPAGTPVDTGSRYAAPRGPLDALDVFWEARGREQCGYVTAEGAAWLASAGTGACGGAAGRLGVLPCGTVFDVVNLPALFGRRVLEQLWAAGPGCGPVAVHRGRVLVFAAPGTAQRLPSLLGWEEWARAVPPLLFHGAGDAVTLPPGHGQGPDTDTRWVVAPGTREPWLPGPGVLLWACVRAARRTPAGGVASQVSAPSRT